MMQEHQTTFTLKAPYFTLNELTDRTSRVWLVFHGYGQLSRFFINKFKGLDPIENFVIAPQGLSKLYLNGFSGRVGSSWMTKEDRLTDIDNQYAYLDSVLENFPDVSGKDLVYFGFSQGVATMCRYSAHSRLPFSKMVIWAGTFPPDLSRQDFDFLSGKEEVVYYTGDKDPFYKKGMKEEQQQAVIDAMDIDPELNVFEGEHQVIPELIKEL